jgi:SAM-dependent methyltransferase
MNMTDAVTVDPSNAAQLGAWDGDEGAYWAAHAERFDRSVAAHHRALFDAAMIAEPEHVLDIGCGTGQTTRDAARAASAGSALGVDLSARMVHVARRRSAAEGVTNASFLQADAQIHPFVAGRFDAAISRTGAMFFGDPPAAFANIGRALAPGGRLVMVAWQGLAANEWIREISGAMAAGRDRPAPPHDAPGPFALSDPDRVRGLLSSVGFTAIELTPLDAGMWFGTGVDDAHRFVVGLVGWMLEGLDERGRQRALDDLRATLAAHATPDGVVLGSAAWIIRATAPPGQRPSRV